MWKKIITNLLNSTILIAPSFGLLTVFKRKVSFLFWKFIPSEKRTHVCPQKYASQPITSMIFFLFNSKFYLFLLHPFSNSVPKIQQNPRYHQLFSTQNAQTCVSSWSICLRLGFYFILHLFFTSPVHSRNTKNLRNSWNFQKSHKSWRNMINTQFSKVKLSQIVKNRENVFKIILECRSWWKSIGPKKRCKYLTFQIVNTKKKRKKHEKKYPVVCFCCSYLFIYRFIRKWMQNVNFAWDKNCFFTKFDWKFCWR